MQLVDYVDMLTGVETTETMRVELNAFHPSGTDLSRLPLSIQCTEGVCLVYCVKKLLEMCQM